MAGQSGSPVDQDKTHFLTVLYSKIHHLHPNNLAMQKLMLISGKLNNWDS